MKILGFLALLAVVTAIAFHGLTWCAFLTYDDQAYVYKNPQIMQGLTWRSIQWAFTSTFFHFYSPVTLLSHMLDVTLFGLNPTGHHLMSLAIHILNACILFLLLFRMTSYPWRSWFVAALFALHPMHVEAVAWIAERKELLCALFGLLSLLAYTLYVQNRSRRAYVAALLLAGVGLLAKPMLVTLPFLMLLLDIWPLGRWRFEFPSPSPSAAGGETPARLGFNLRESARAGWPLLLEKLPFFGLSLAISVATFWLNKVGGTINSAEMLPLHLRIANGIYAYGQYMVKLCFPVNLSVFYPHPGRSISWFLVSLSAALLLLATALFLLAFRKRPYLIVGWLWFLGAMVPVSGIIQIGSLQSYADRYTYFTYTGLFLAAVWFVSDLVAPRSACVRKAVVSLAVLILIGLGWQTYRQVACWKDSEALFRHADEVVSKRNSLIVGQLGVIRYLKHGDMEGAKSLLKEAISLNPGYWPNWAALGYFLALQNKLSEAAACYQQAREVGGRKDYTVNFNLGKSLFGQGKYAEALEAYQAALVLAPDSEECARYVVDCLVRLGRAPEAKPVLNRALEADAADTGFLAQLASIQAVEGQESEAEGTIARALAEGNSSPGAKYTVAYALLAPPEVPRAILAKATSLAEEACAATGGNNPPFLQTLATAYEKAGRHEDAEQLRRKAASLLAPGGPGPARPDAPLWKEP